VNDRQRLQAILHRQPPDRIPWIPRLLLWYNARVLTNTLPARWQGRSLREIERDLGLGTPARDGVIYTQRYEEVDIVERHEGERLIIEHHTPVGTVRTVERITRDLAEQGLPGRIEEYPLKTPADYRVWEWVVEHTYWDPAYEVYEAYDAEIGADGLPMVQVGDVPLHEFAQTLAGYEHAFLQMADYPREVDHLLSLMTEVQRERQWPVIVDSPAGFFLHGQHLSSQFTPPRLFERYVLPYYQEFTARLHEHGKYVAMHADNDTSSILHYIEQAGWDVVECFVTAPMVPLTLEQARAAWGDQVIIWGGLPSTFLSPHVPLHELEDYVHYIFDTIAPGDAFILGVADNVMPDSDIERVARVTEIVQERGKYPVSR
jgi:hypothetical protein